MKAKLLDSMATKLVQTKDQTSNQPNKRKRLEAPEGDIRRSYPKESKTLYLKTKTLHKKKLNLATNIHQIKKNLEDKKFPVQADFNCAIPANRDATFRDKWTHITTDAKIKLTLLEDRNSKIPTEQA